MGGESHLEDADLNGADLRRAGLDSAILVDANLRGAKLDDADLSGADLKGAQLHGADLRKVRGLTWVQIASAFISRNTQLPPDVGAQMPGNIKALLERAGLG
jgi:Pentapeptide repeats (8 copies)